MKCLMIDDDIPTVEVMRDFIDWNSLGIGAVLTAHNITDAKVLIDADKPDIIICDIEMPRGSGLDMIKWVRDNHHDCAFIFFTCHENFEFASTAISYNTDAYLIKPFDKSKVEAALAKTVNSLRAKNQLQAYSQFGASWLKNKSFVEQSFWRDILFAQISPRLDLIHGEIRKRDLSLELEHGYSLVLTSIGKSDIQDSWNESTFIYAFSNLTSETMLDNLHLSHVINYQQDDRYYVATIISGSSSLEEITTRCRQQIRYCREFFQCTATCYISKKVPIDVLHATKTILEVMDRNNIIYKGNAHYQEDRFEYVTNESYTLDVNGFESLFIEGEKVQIVNKLKKDLESLTKSNKLDAGIMHSIKQDFMQLVYSILYKNKIHAHKLFSDNFSGILLQKSEHSVMDMMKWAAFVTNKTIDYLREVKQSESVVEKVKTFIRNHYHQELSREDVAASVYLSPDYLAKMFKNKTGLSMKDYLNEHRILIAKERLIQGNESIGTIAVEIGFDSISYFSTVFKKITNETPNAFRAKHKQ
ncbi:response regulator transcription factor [Paenibacillus andongensis]|uniref:response regulator transcription factor n=1 Tax=Paenibacillus andongensis TaxID=2975482 RepID=UPI0021BA820E|nr:helix-turn-helix domain-containing protein [Paenibacillus andongensis]